MKTEDIILTDSSRGMDKAAEFLPDNFCSIAARNIINLKNGTIFLITGFWVNGHGETDGPAGTYVIYKTLEKLGFDPVIITEEFCSEPYEDMNVLTKFSIKTSPNEYRRLINEFSPVAVISIERCGRNESGTYCNMRGEDIGEYTSNFDELFELCNYCDILTVGIGDGGNEIGMGNISDKIRNIVNVSPCEIKARHLITSTVSNWGAYALASNLQRLSKKNVMPHFTDVKKFYEKMRNAGFIDGITGKNEMSVDGFDIYDEKEIYELLTAQTF